MFYNNKKVAFKALYLTVIAQALVLGGADRKKLMDVDVLIEKAIKIAPEKDKQKIKEITEALRCRVLKIKTSYWVKQSNRTIAKALHGWVLANV